jgi:hypothetical protein
MDFNVDVGVPEYSIGVMDVGGREIMILEISTAGTRNQYVLATKENYREVADKLAEGIRRMGAEMKSVLITPVKEIPDGLKKKGIV